MNYSFLRSKRFIVLSSIVILSLTAWFVLWYLSFRLITVNPQEPIPTSTSEITFVFSKNLKKDQKIEATTNPEMKGTYTIKDNTIVFNPDERFFETTIIFSIKTIQADNSDVIHNFSKELDITYVDFNNLTSEEQNKQINESDGGQADFPILNGYLPHAAYNYTLDFMEPQDDSELILTVDTYGKAETETDESYVARMEQAYKDVMQYIEEHRGITPMNMFVIFFSDDYLSRYNTIQHEEEAD